MAVNKDMFHAQTTPSNQLFNTACEVLDGVSELKEKIAELNAENEIQIILRPHPQNRTRQIQKTIFPEGKSTCS